MLHLNRYETTKKIKSMHKLAGFSIGFVSSKTTQEDAGKVFEFDSRVGKRGDYVDRN